MTEQSGSTVLRSIARTAAALLLVAGGVLTGCDSHTVTGDKVEDASLSNVVAGTNALSTLDAALRATGQFETLDNDDATFTVFAPANSAFARYRVDFLVENPDLLSSVINYHVVQGQALRAEDLSEGTQTVQTVQGNDLTVRKTSEGDVFANGARVVQANVEGTNGVAHVVEDVLLTNRNLAERLQVTQSTVELYRVAADVGLAGAFASADNQWTTFAPSSQALNNADLSGLSDSEIQDVLRYHVVEGVTDSEALLQLLEDNGGRVSLTTLQGDDITVRLEGESTVTINGDQATIDLNQVDQRASNGIIHVIDGVLLPPSMQ